MPFIIFAPLFNFIRTFFSGLFSGLFAFIKSFFTKLLGGFGEKILAGLFLIVEPIWQAILNFFSRLPIYIAWFGLFYALYLALVAGLSALFAGFMPIIPGSITTAIGWFLPSNIMECLTVVYASKLYRFAYDHKMTAIKMKLLAQT